MHGNILSRRAPPSRSSPPTSKKRKLDEGPSTEYSVEGQILEDSKGKKQATSINTEAEGVLNQGSDGGGEEPAVIYWKNLNENERQQVEAWKRGRFDASAIKGFISSIVEEIRTISQPSKLSPTDSKQQCLIDMPRSSQVVVTDTSATIVKTLAKMFIGDLVEGARSSMVNAGVPQTSTLTQKPLPIPPEYYLEAWRQVVENNEVPGVSQHLCGEHSVLVATPKHECHPRGLI